MRHTITSMLAVVFLLSAGCATSPRYGVTAHEMLSVGDSEITAHVKQAQTMGIANSVLAVGGGVLAGTFVGNAIIEGEPEKGLLAVAAVGVPVYLLGQSCDNHMKKAADRYKTLKGVTSRISFGLLPDSCGRPKYALYYSQTF